MSETADERTVKDRISFLRTLRSVRSFRSDPVPQAVLDDVLEVARWSGSATNKQPWEILIIRERETLRSLASVGGYADHLAGASLGIVLIMAGERAEQETYDEGKLSERIMLAAHAHGVGSSIGWFTGSGRDETKELLRIPREKVVRTAISLGYPDERERRSRTGRRQARKSLAEIVREERYG